MAVSGADGRRQRRRELLTEWLARFHERYEVLAQLSNLYFGDEWERLRKELLPKNGERAGGKCPLGFGSKMEMKVVTRTKDVGKMQTIVFQGRRYDVTDSSLFQQDTQLGHFVVHDVTYALAVQSTRPEDLDVTPTRMYTFEEQLLLERYRNLFARELVLLEVDDGQEPKEGTGGKEEVVSLHALIDQSDEMTQEGSTQRLQEALNNTNTAQLDEVCVRTTMTPLHKAVEKHRLDFVMLLLQAGADLEARAALYDDETPLEMARRFHFEDIVEHLESLQ